jgi:hypothetical protein
MIDEEFYRNALAGRSLLLAGSPIDTAVVSRFAARREIQDTSLDGDELVCICRCP